MRQNPRYDLDRVRKLFLLPSRVITRTAMDAGLNLGFDEQDMEDVVCSLTKQHFYKSMPADRAPGLWQDVYKVTSQGIPLYVKIQVRHSGAEEIAVLISFKEDESTP